jgi:hypothetical protein
LAGRLRRNYFDANEKHFLRPIGDALATLPLREARSGVGANSRWPPSASEALLAGIPVALAMAGCAWQAGIDSKRAPMKPLLGPNSAVAVNHKKEEKMTYA